MKTTEEQLTIAIKALKDIEREKWYGCKKSDGHLFCHPEGCESPQIAKNALKEIKQ